MAAKGAKLNPQPFNGKQLPEASRSKCTKQPPKHTDETLTLLVNLFSLGVSDETGNSEDDQVNKEPAVLWLIFPPPPRKSPQAPFRPRDAVFPKGGAQGLAGV